jgi:hypothetical protein
LSEKPRQKTQAKILLLCKDSSKTQKKASATEEEGTKNQRRKTQRTKERNRGTNKSKRAKNWKETQETDTGTIEQKR